MEEQNKNQEPTSKYQPQGFLRGVGQTQNPNMNISVHAK